MNFESTCKLVGTKTGTNSKGNDWYLLKFIDNEDKHINIFDTKENYEKVIEGHFYIVSFNLYYNLKDEKYNLSGKVVQEYEC